MLKVESIWIVMLILCPVHSHYNQLAGPPKGLLPPKILSRPKNILFTLFDHFFHIMLLDTGTDSHMLAHLKLVHLFNLNLRRNLNEGLNEAGSAGRGRNEAN